MPDPDANDTRRVTHSALCLLCLLVALLSGPTVADAAETAAVRADQAGETRPGKLARANSLPVVPHVEVVMGATFTNHIVTGALLSNSLPVAPRLVAFVNHKQMLWIEAFQTDYKPTKVLTTKMVDAFQHTPKGPRKLRLINPANHCLIAKDSLVGSPPWTLTITLKPTESPWGWPKEMPKADLQPKTWSFIYRKEWVNHRW